MKLGKRDGNTTATASGNKSCLFVIFDINLTILALVILANGRAAFFESCDAIGWNSCDVSQKR